MLKIILIPAVFFLILSGCASTRAVIKQDYDFSSVKSVRVGRFTSNGNYSNSGSAVQNAFISQLLSKGYNVKTGRNAETDAVIRGSVTTYIPDKKYLVRQSGDGRVYDGRDVYIYANDITEVGGGTMYDLGPAFGLNEPNKIMASNATVGVYAYMEDSATGEIVWAYSYTYEGLDLAAALDGAVKHILRSLPSSNLKK